MFIKVEMGRTFKAIAKWKGLVTRAWHICYDHIYSIYSLSYL
ncbi:MAG: hypothetical protein BWX82_00364 [Parcubacteria group bacterium ADurb.Bin115]|nr:MAG: hypothetical protein BWX82_00364 [Parcubacteria group bacterium ADurb.Bin115]